ncbi:ABC transporter permease [Algoriphagus namhaensis]|uniref:ABC transporter permease n=1 Tax=Algoriphagus namhaensis TaxID=915353 RepID=A0ABV8AW18_9BACT
MLQNYLKIAWRNMLRNKALSFINITGLAIGVGTCLLIVLFVFNELSYDRYNEFADRIVRVNLEGKIGDVVLNESTVMAPVGETLVSEIPEVQSSVRVNNPRKNTRITVGDKTIRSGTTAYVDPNFFEIFTLPFIQGDAKTALSKPFSIVLTSAQAKLIFGDVDPMNKNLYLEDMTLMGDYTVTGIIDEVPSNSHFHFDLFVSMLGNADSKNQNWLSGSYTTYLLLNEAAEVASVQEKLPSIVEKYMSGQMKQGLGMSFEEFFAKGNFIRFKLMPLTGIHLDTQFDGPGQFEAGGDVKTIMIYSAIAIFMLLIACINFMNLSTAGASKRAKEIGIRKVMGSEKFQLIFQFLSESFISILLALVLGFIFAGLFLQFFNDFTGKSLSLLSLISLENIALLGFFVLVITILAGGYPAFFLSEFKPIDSLKKRFGKTGSSGLRSGLVIFQFAVSVTLIIGTIVVNQQMYFIQDAEIGYDRDQLIILRDAGLLEENLDVFKSRIEADPRVLMVSKSAFVPAGPSDNNVQNLYSDVNPELPIRITQYGVDAAYIPTMGMEIVLGRNFSSEMGNENANIIINQTAARELGIAEDPIGQIVQQMSDLEGGRQSLTVIGVLKDFNAKSLRDPISPLMMKFDPYYSLIVKASPSDIPGLLNEMGKNWLGFNPGQPFNYAFLDELYNETYREEAKMGEFLTALSLLTIFVACLGLFGLVTFTAEQRVKEIGIRKVLGSSLSQIVTLLAKDFIKLVFISFLIAFPLGYYLMENWLQEFAFRINLEWWFFVVAGIITLMIALMTISFRSVKAALINPVKSLKSE